MALKLVMQSKKDNVIIDFHYDDPAKTPTAISNQLMFLDDIENEEQLKELSKRVAIKMALNLRHVDENSGEYIDYFTDTIHKYCIPLILQRTLPKTLTQTKIES